MLITVKAECLPVARLQWLRQESGDDVRRCRFRLFSETGNFARFAALFATIHPDLA